MNPVTYPFRVWSTVLLLALVVGVGFGLYHVATDIARERARAAAIRAAEARADSAETRFARAVARGDSLADVAQALTDSARAADYRADSLRAVADTARARVTRMRDRFTVVAAPPTLDTAQWIMAQWDTVPFPMPRAAAHAVVELQNLVRVQALAIDAGTRARATWEASSVRWQAAAESRGDALDSAQVALTAKDSVIAAHLADRPSRLRRLWEKVDAPLAFLGGAYLGVRAGIQIARR